MGAAGNPGNAFSDQCRRVGHGSHDSDLAENGLEGAFFTPQYWPVVLGDGVNGNDLPYQSTFPYVALPHEGFANSHGDPQPTTP